MHAPTNRNKFAHPNKPKKIHTNNTKSCARTPTKNARAPDQSVSVHPQKQPASMRLQARTHLPSIAAHKKNPANNPPSRPTIRATRLEYKQKARIPPNNARTPPPNHARAPNKQTRNSINEMLCVRCIGSVGRGSTEAESSAASCHSNKKLPHFPLAAASCINDALVDTRWRCHTSRANRSQWSTLPRSPHLHS